VGGLYFGIKMIGGLQRVEREQGRFFCGWLWVLLWVAMGFVMGFVMGGYGFCRGSCRGWLWILLWVW
jgi:hypothetical protein